jgi:hypothetical protein
LKSFKRTPVLPAPGENRRKNESNAKWGIRYGGLKKQMIRTQMNADFQDSIKPKKFLGIYLNKSASLTPLSNSCLGHFFFSLL